MLLNAGDHQISASHHYNNSKPNPCDVIGEDGTHSSCQPGSRSSESMVISGRVRSPLSRARAATRRASGRSTCASRHRSSPKDETQPGGDCHSARRRFALAWRSGWSGQSRPAATRRGGYVDFPTVRLEENRARCGGKADLPEHAIRMPGGFREQPTKPNRRGCSKYCPNNCPGSKRSRGNSERFVFSATESVVVCRSLCVCELLRASDIGPSWPHQRTHDLRRRATGPWCCGRQPELSQRG